MNNDAILNKLIELGYVETIPDSIYFNYFDADGEEIAQELFNPEKRAADFELVLRALFDVCAKKSYRIIIHSNSLHIDICEFNHLYVGDEFIREVYKGDTSRESFIAAFCKVTGVEL